MLLPVPPIYCAPSGHARVELPKEVDTHRARSARRLGPKRLASDPVLATPRAGLNLDPLLFSWPPCPLPFPMHGSAPWIAPRIPAAPVLLPAPATPPLPHPAAAARLALRRVEQFAIPLSRTPLASRPWLPWPSPFQQQLPDVRRNQASSSEQPSSPSLWLSSLGPTGPWPSR